MRGARFWIALVLAVPGATGVAPASEPVEVTQVWTATWDVRDFARKGTTLLGATSGGLVEWRSGRVRRWSDLAARVGGARLRSASTTRRGVWLGAVEGAALVDADNRRILRRLELPRVRRVVDWQGATWLSTEERGLFVMRAGGALRHATLGQEPALERQSDLAVFEGDLWIATAGGLVRLGPDGRARARWTEGYGLQSNLVWDLEVDGDRLLVATSDGLAVVRDGLLDPAAQVALQSTALPVRDIRAIRARRGTVLVGTFGAGAFRLDPGAEPRRLGCPGCDRVQALAWNGRDALVAHDAGLARVSLEGTAPRALETAGLPADLTCLAHAFGDLWVGSFDRGLFRLGGDGRIGRVTDPRTPMDPRILDLEPTPAGDALWIATARGVLRHDGRRIRSAPGPGAPDGDWAMDLHVDPRTGALWVASSRSLSRLERGRWARWTSAGRERLEGLLAVTTDDDGHVWVGGHSGLFELDPATGDFTRHSVASGELPMDFVTAVTTWRGGVVAGTLGGGLVRIDRDGHAERLAGVEGLADRVNPHAAGVFGDDLWVGTPDRGLLFVTEPSSHSAPVDTASGLPASDVTALLAIDGDEAWVTTRGGLARVRFRVR